MKTIKATFAIVTLVAGTQAWAGHRGDVAYADVVDVRPVYEQIPRHAPVQECWVEQVRYETPSYERRSATGTILGTMIGAAVGHNLGRSKNGQQVGRIAGAVLGASIGSDVSARNRAPSRVEYRDEQRCATRHTTSYDEVVVGYDVTYQYHGQNYHTRMDEYPGRRIPVAVDVRPAY